MQACVHVCWEGVPPWTLCSQEALIPIIAGSPLCSSGQAEQIPAPGLLRDHCLANSEDGMGRADLRELFILPLGRRVPETLQDCGHSTRHPRTRVQSPETLHRSQRCCRMQALPPGTPGLAIHVLTPPVCPQPSVTPKGLSYSSNTCSLRQQPADPPSE